MSEASSQPATTAKSSSMSSLVPKQALKLGIAVGVVVAVINIVALVPILGIFLVFLVWVVGIVAGYALIYTVGGSKDKLPDALKNAAITGAISGVLAGVGSGIAGVLSTVFFSRVSLFGYYYTPGLSDYIGAFVGGFIGAVIGMIIWYIIGAVVELYYTPDKLPESVKTYLDKIKAFASK